MGEQNHRFIRGLSAGREALFLPGCRPVERRLFVSVNRFHARHVRERGCSMGVAGEGREQPIPIDKFLGGTHNLSNPKPGHTTGGSGRGARRSGRAGSGRIGCQQNYSPRKQRSLVPSKASKKRRFNVSPEAQTNEILCKPTEKQNQRLTTSSSPVYPRFISGTRSALSSWLLTSGTTPFCLCKPFSCKACPGTCRV